MSQVPPNGSVASEATHNRIAMSLVCGPTRGAGTAQEARANNCANSAAVKLVSEIVTSVSL